MTGRASASAIERGGLLDEVVVDTPSIGASGRARACDGCEESSWGGGSLNKSAVSSISAGGAGIETSGSVIGGSEDGGAGTGEGGGAEA